MRKLAVLASTIGFVLIGSVGSVSAATPPTCQIESPVTQVIGENCVYPPAPTTTIEAQIPPPPPATLPVTGADSSNTMQTAGLVVLAGAALVGVAAVRRRRPQSA
ncbi:unannotated protein [freshwater metagenome]|uniref:Unannotated protein n=1 Tax=freshwater metagenome TaxID=449393 RepID=A0A6J7D0V0_9ZZZZ